MVKDQSLNLGDYTPTNQRSARFLPSTYDSGKAKVWFTFSNIIRKAVEQAYSYHTQVTDCCQLNSHAVCNEIIYKYIVSCIVRY